MIVKIQLPLMSNEGYDHAMIYDKERTFIRIVEGKDFPAVKKMMGDDVKKFFHAKVEGKTLKLTEEAEWQEW